MSWFENLKRTVGRAVTQNPVVRSVTQSAPVRLAGRALGSTFVKPTIGFRPEIAGVVLSELLPKGNPVKQVVDAGLYLGSGPLSVTASLAGSTPQANDPYGNWQRLGYRSRAEMEWALTKATPEQRATLAATARGANKLPGVYIADDYGPTRPVRLLDGTVSLGEYRIDRFNPQQPTPVASATTPVAALAGSSAPVSTPAAAPATTPVTRRAPATTTSIPAAPPAPVVDTTRQAVEDELLARATQQRTDDLVRQMTELGVTGGMTPENMRKWVGANAGLADRLIQDRLGREARLAKEFAGFSGYPQ